MKYTRIIYENPDGTLAFLVPAPDCGLTIEQIAAKDVPAGVPYKIVHVDDFPEDDVFRDAWRADMTDPHGVGADYGVGTNNEVMAWAFDGTPIIQTIVPE